MEMLWKGMEYRPGFRGSFCAEDPSFFSKDKVPSLAFSLPRASQSSPCLSACGMRAVSRPRRPNNIARPTCSAEQCLEVAQ